LANSIWQRYVEIWIILSNMGHICKILKKDGQLFTTHNTNFNCRQGNSDLCSATSIWNL
jgi:hypothetical protein